MRPPVGALINKSKEAKQGNTNIASGSVVTANIEKIEDKIKERQRKRMRKEVAGCIQDGVGKNNFLIQLKDGHQK